MSRCQKCGGPLEGDFGVVHCAQCGEVNFLDEDPSPAPSRTQEQAQSQVGEVPNWQIPPPGEFSAPEETPALPAALDSEQNSEAMDAELALQDIEAFGNRNLNTTETGTLIYTVRISGIDTKELRQAVVEELKDSKFGWRWEDMENRIHDGVLEISSLGPTKASVLVKRLRHLDLQIYWKQERIYEASHS